MGVAWLAGLGPGWARRRTPSGRGVAGAGGTKTRTQRVCALAQRSHNTILCSTLFSRPGCTSQPRGFVHLISAGNENKERNGRMKSQDDEMKAQRVGDSTWSPLSSCSFFFSFFFFFQFDYTSSVVVHGSSWLGSFEQCPTRDATQPPHQDGQDIRKIKKLRTSL